MTTSGAPRAVPHPIEWTDEKVSRLWDYYSQTPPYNEMYFSKVSGDRILATSGLPLRRPLRVLDFGCGPGFLWDHLRGMGARWRYTGLDFSRDSVAEVTRKAAGDSRFEGAAYVVQLPSAIAAGQYDVVFLIEVVEHLKDEYLEGTFRECIRLLAQGGVLVVTTPNDEDFAAAVQYCPDCGAVFHRWQHVRTWSAASLVAYGRARGLAVRKCVTLDFGTRGLVGHAARFARRLLGRKVNPHLMVVFQKP